MSDIAQPVEQELYVELAKLSNATPKPAAGVPAASATNSSTPVPQSRSESNGKEILFGLIELLQGIEDNLEIKAMDRQSAYINSQDALIAAAAKYMGPTSEFEYPEWNNTNNPEKSYSVVFQNKITEILLEKDAETQIADAELDDKAGQFIEQLAKAWRETPDNCDLAGKLTVVSIAIINSRDILSQSQQQELQSAFHENLVKPSKSSKSVVVPDWSQGDSRPAPEKDGDLFAKATQLVVDTLKAGGSDPMASVTADCNLLLKSLQTKLGQLVPPSSRNNPLALGFWISETLKSCTPNLRNVGRINDLQEGLIESTLSLLPNYEEPNFVTTLKEFLLKSSKSLKPAPGAQIGLNRDEILLLIPQELKQGVLKDPDKREALIGSLSRELEGKLGNSITAVEKLLKVEISEDELGQWFNDAGVPQGDIQLDTLAKRSSSKLSRKLAALFSSDSGSRIKDVVDAVFKKFSITGAQGQFVAASLHFHEISRLSANISHSLSLLEGDVSNKLSNEYAENAVVTARQISVARSAVAEFAQSIKDLSGQSIPKGDSQLAKSIETLSNIGSSLNTPPNKDAMAQAETACIKLTSMAGQMQPFLDDRVAKDVESVKQLLGTLRDNFQQALDTEYDSLKETKSVYFEQFDHFIGAKFAMETHRFEARAINEARNLLTSLPIKS